MSSSMYFDTPFSFEKSIHVLTELSVALLGENHELADLIRSRDWVSVVGFKPVADSSVALVDFYRQAQFAAFFRKNAAIPLGINCQSVALSKFLASEESCRAVNNRFRNRSATTAADAALIFSVQRKIADILGPFPGIDKLTFGFGPGANVGLSRFTSLRRKLSVDPTCSAGAWKYVPVLQEYFPTWRALENPVPCDYGKYASVPKDASTNRSILVEPLVNSFLQKGVGSYIRERLSLVRVNLNDQSINQDRARKGSLTGEYATLDLAAASDTISREVVAELLPYDWWEFMEDIRSKYALMPDGKQIVLQKFSSMGNGFTFELESLIFYAIAVCAGDSDVSVYGDDIIVRTEMFEPVISALTAFGFSINLDKSFVSGPFRESCGCDYFDGISVRPVFVKTLLSVKEMFRLHNYFIRNGWSDLAAICCRHIPLRFRLYGPDGYGDGHLLGEHPYTRSRQLRRAGWGGYVFRSYRTAPIVRDEALSGDYAAFLCLETGCNPLEVSGDWRPHRLSHIGDGGKSQSSTAMFSERGRGKYRPQHVYCLELT